MLGIQKALSCKSIEMRNDKTLKIGRLSARHSEAWFLNQQIVSLKPESGGIFK